MENKLRLRKVITAALFTALVCVATSSIRIPTTGTGGYIHPGDALVIISGIILGPLWGFVAAGIGSALADLFGGFLIYAPITFVIKGLIALVTAFIARLMPDRRYAVVALGGLTDIILVAGGYFLCEIPMYGAAAALLSVPANLIQGVGGLVIALILYPAISRIPQIKGLSR